MAMSETQFYSVVLKKHIKIPKNKIKEVTKSGRRFAVGDYVANGKKYKAWKILGAAKK